MRIEKIEIIVTFDSGESIRLVEEDPAPSGGNPRFLGQQFLYGSKNLTRRLLALIEAYHPGQLLPKDDN